MIPDKVRIKKRLHERIDRWLQALDIPATNFVEDALDFYLRHLEGKLQLDITPDKPLISVSPVVETDVEDDDDDSLDDFTGGIEL